MTFSNEHRHSGKQPRNHNCSGRTLGDIINSPNFPIADRNKVIEIIEEIFTPFESEDAFIIHSIPPGKITPIKIELNPHWNPNHKHFYNIVVEFMSQTFTSYLDFNNPDKIEKFFRGLKSPKKIKSFHTCGAYLNKTMKLLTRFCCPGDDVLVAYQERYQQTT